MDDQKLKTIKIIIYQLWNFRRSGDVAGAFAVILPLFVSAPMHDRIPLDLEILLTRSIVISLRPATHGRKRNRRIESTEYFRNKDRRLKYEIYLRYIYCTQTVKDFCRRKKCYRENVSSFSRAPEYDRSRSSRKKCNVDTSGDGPYRYGRYGISNLPPNKH